MALLLCGDMTVCSKAGSSACTHDVFVNEEKG